MIGRVAGRLVYRAGDHVLIDVGGVGYVVHCSDRVLAAMPPPGEAVALFTELLVREDLLQLFGFPTLAEKEWHRLLTSVQGVGAKAALAILGTLGADGVGRAIALGDAAAVRAAPGVGPKLASRVVMELKDKAPAVMAMGASLAAAQGTVPAAAMAGDPAPPSRVRRPAAAVGASAAPSPAQAQSEALSALTNLGYAPAEAMSAVAEAAAADPDAATPALIRAALRLLSPKG